MQGVTTTKAGRVAKAIYATAVAVLGALATTLTGEQNLGDLTTLQWVVVAGVGLAAFGGVYQITNQPSE